MPEPTIDPGWDEAPEVADDARRDRSFRVVVHDRSMEPALKPGDKLLVDGEAYHGADPARGHVVVVRDPAAPDRLLVKRVVATAGDVIRVTRSGVVPAPTEGLPPEADALEELEIPPAHLFVLSDRSAGARDSRQFGPVPQASVVGRAWFRYAPLHRRGRL